MAIQGKHHEDPGHVPEHIHPGESAKNSPARDYPSSISQPPASAPEIRANISNLPNIGERKDQAKPLVTETRSFLSTDAKGGPCSPDRCDSLVSGGSTWQGNLKIDGSVRVDGKLSGEVEAENTVHISEGAQVDAKVHAAYVVIAGSFEGQVDCTERLELMPTSRVKGDFAAKSLMVHEGAFVDGQIRVVRNERGAGEQASLPATPSVETGNSKRKLLDPLPEVSKTATVTEK